MTQDTLLQQAFELATERAMDPDLPELDREQYRRIADLVWASYCLVAATAPEGGPDAH